MKAFRLFNVLMAFVLAFSGLFVASPQQAAVAAPQTSQPQDNVINGAACGGLFFSEYVEGSSNNKALEIYNGTGASVDIGNYKIKMYFNGALTVGTTVTIPASTTLSNNDVYVLTIDDASQALRDLADIVVDTPPYWFNGDDAITLEDNNGIILDIIGQIGNDPGSQWGTGNASTADNTIRRKATVSSGDTNGSDAFDPSGEWDGYANDTFSGLGAHTAACGAGDTPPAVFSTTPADNATGVFIDTNISVTFDEAVTITDSFFDLTCATSGAHAVATNTVDNITYTLNPVVDFANNELCTATVQNDQVTDQDGTPASMTADYVFDFTTVAADAAPIVTAVTPADDATKVAVGSNLTVEFSEAVSLSSGWYTLTCGGTPATSTYSGSGASYTIDPTANLPAGTACDATIIATQVVDTDGVPTYMAADYPWNFTTTFCGTTYTAIHAIQGTTDIPALTGVQTTQGVVTVDYQSGGFNGFYLQAVPGTEDTNPLTSEGIFVWNTTFPVNVGDLVRLTGTAGNSTGGGFMTLMTQFTNLTDLEICGTTALPAPVAITLPVGADYLEPYEGMLVTFTQTLTVEQNFFQGRYGQLTLGLGRLFQANNFSLLGGDLTSRNSMIILDDGATAQNPNPIPYLLTDGAVRAGNTVTNLVGVIDNGAINTSTSITTWPYAYYRLQPTSAPVFDNTVNARSATPPDVGGTLTIASFNVLNYFTTLDMAPYRTTFPYTTTTTGGNTPRGADSVAEFTRQEDKLVAALIAMDADVIGLMEIESWDGANGGLGAPQALVDALNTIAGAGTYDFVADPVLGHFDIGTDTDSDYIQVAIIYKPARVTPVGDALSVDDLVFDRSPFAQEFEEISSGQQFVVVVNHFKSKGSCPSEFLDPENTIPNPDYPGNFDDGDGQGCWNAKRIEQAEALLDFINTDLLPLDQDVFVIGDLNSYGMEEPIGVLMDGGMVNHVASLVPQAEQYSYVFDGTAGYLDHALGTAWTVPQVTDVSFWHINADEPSVIDYNTEYKPSDLYLPHIYRSSDHDPVLIGLDLEEANDWPIAIDDFYSTDEDTVLTVAAADGVLDNDVDNDPTDVKMASLLTDAANGTIYLFADGSFNYTPDPDFYGTDSFEYTLITYPGGKSTPYTDDAVVTITVNPTPDGPVAVDDTYEVTEDGSLTVPAPGVLANDYDPDPEDVSFYITLIDDADFGWLTLRQDGSFTYTPNAGFVGTDTFEYMFVSTPAKGGPYTDTAIVTITVNESVAPRIAEQTAVSGFDFSFTLPAGSFDAIEGKVTLSAKLADGSPLPSWLTFDPATGTFSGKPQDADVRLLNVKVYATNETGSYVTNGFPIPTIVKLFFPMIGR